MEESSQATEHKPPRFNSIYNFTDNQYFAYYKQLNK